MARPTDDRSTTNRLPGARAVSPVIGVILVTALTVIMAAVIGTFVLGFDASLDENATAAVSVDCTDGAPGEVTVTWTADNSADRVVVTAEGDAFTTDHVFMLSDVGDAQTFTESAGDTSDRQTATTVVIAEDGGTRTVMSNKDCGI